MRMVPWSDVSRRIVLKGRRKHRVVAVSVLVCATASTTRCAATSAYAQLPAPAAPLAVRPLGDTDTGQCDEND